MAACAKFARRSGSLLTRSSSPILLPTKRSFSAITCNERIGIRGRASLLRYQWKRKVTQSAHPSITGQEAPSAGAYISSGILSGQKNLEDVKKVLVIGSGGLSIGQAGEFDYSGKIRFSADFDARKTFLRLFNFFPFLVARMQLTLSFSVVE